MNVRSDPAAIEEAYRLADLIVCALDQTTLPERGRHHSIIMNALLDDTQAKADSARAVRQATVGSLPQTPIAP